MAWSIQEQDEASANIYMLGQDVLCWLIVLKVRELITQ